MGGDGLDPGDEIAGYRVERSLGAGGMGMVYLVLQPSLGKRFALKLLPSFLTNEPEFVGRFEREMRTVSRLDHPHIVATTNAGTSDGRVWYTMTYVRGIDAAEAIRRAPDGLPPDRVIGIVDAIADALDFAHRHGVAHRDVKPGNVLLGDDGRVFLTDFGIAKVVGETSTMTTFQPFTADFASPEQVANEAVGTRTDIYSLGATCHALLTGQVPFPGDHTAKIYGHRHLPPPRPSVVRPVLPPGVDRVIATAMAKNPAGRYGTCVELAGALRQSLAAAAATQLAPDPGDRPAPAADTRVPTPTGGVRPNLPEQPSRTDSPQSWKPANRGRRWIVVAAATALLLVGGGYAVQTTLGGRTGGTAAAPDVAATGSTESADDGGAAATQPSRAPSATSPSVTATSAATGATGGSSGTAVVPLQSLLSPAPAARSGTSGDVPVAGAAAVELGPSNCPNGSQRYSVGVGSGLQRITGTFLMSDNADPDTRTQVTVTADGVPVAAKTVAPRAGATIDVDVRGVRDLTIDLATAGSGPCGSGDYLVFLTNALAYR
ncbi:protein kinase domain-containing protein [Nakamurella sp.]|uniref:serine/threonine-protein kinase n=1 Tax=Nakamurella sp. TaxID=1869182 RepID=UPI003783DFE1